VARARLRFAYNTNGLQSHRLEDALDLLADAGYAGVSLTLDHMHLDPLAAGPAELRRVRRALETRNLQCGVETGARFLLDPRRKHRPTLVEKDALGRAKRLDLLLRSVDVAAEIGARSLTYASGPRDPDVSPETALLFLQEATERLDERARAAGVGLALEPEPAHFPATLEAWRRLHALVPVGLALDVTHLGVEAPEPAAPEAIRSLAAELVVVHLADSPRNVHDHRPFGEGDLDLRGTLAALMEIEFTGLVSVELSRHSHAAHEVVPRSLEKLRAAVENDK
jgi:sugar phosphate isomerase/epimerase